MHFKCIDCFLRYKLQSANNKHFQNYYYSQHFGLPVREEWAPSRKMQKLCSTSPPQQSPLTCAEYTIKDWKNKTIKCPPCHCCWWLTCQCRMRSPLQEDAETYTSKLNIPHRQAQPHLQANFPPPEHGGFEPVHFVGGHLLLPECHTNWSNTLP